MSPNRCVLRLIDEAATLAAGDALGAALVAPAVIHLDGDLGAGKTTLARAAIQHHEPTMRVKSPTYALIETYTLRGLTVHHLDLYRIRDQSELEALSLRELLADVLLIEWPEKGGFSTPSADLVIRLAHADEGREIALEPTTTIGIQIAAHLQHILQGDTHEQSADDGFVTKKT